jgi:hypothetical protein
MVETQTTWVGDGLCTSGDHERELLASLYHCWCQAISGVFVLSNVSCGLALTSLFLPRALGNFRTLLRRASPENGTVSHESRKKLESFLPWQSLHDQSTLSQRNRFPPIRIRTLLGA